MMKQNQSDKYTIAWFKLAECVARGEREKALGVYRLLSHSLDDKAYALQLEGDLLWAFGDDRAVIRYKKAAELYHEQMRFKHAIALYQHIYDASGDAKEIAEQLVVLCGEIGDMDAMIFWQEKLIGLLVHSYEIDYACDQVTFWSEQAEPKERARLYQALVYALCAVCPAQKERITPFLHTLIDTLLLLDDSASLNTFLSELEVRNSAYARDAKKYLHA